MYRPDLVGNRRVYLKAIVSTSMSREGMAQSAGSDIPQTGTVVKPSGKAAAIRTEADTIDRPEVSSEGIAKGASGNIPQTERAVPTSCGEAAAIWAETYLCDACRMSNQDMTNAPRRNIP